MLEKRRVTLTWWGASLWCLSAWRGGLLALQDTQTWFEEWSYDQKIGYSGPTKHVVTAPLSPYYDFVSGLVNYGGLLVVWLFFGLALPMTVHVIVSTAKQEGVNRQLFQMIGCVIAGIIVNLLAGWLVVYAMVGMSWSGRYEILAEIFFYLFIAISGGGVIASFRIMRAAVDKIYPEPVVYVPAARVEATPYKVEPVPPAPPPPIPLPTILN